MDIEDPENLHLSNHHGTVNSQFVCPAPPKGKEGEKTFLRLSVTEPGYSLALEDGEFLGGDDGRALDLPGAHQ